MKGFEPPTPSLPWKCSTPELHRQCFERLTVLRWAFAQKQKEIANGTRFGDQFFKRSIRTALLICLCAVYQQI